MTWQSVETPPEDGTSVLVWAPNRIEPSYAYRARGGGRYRWFEHAHRHATDPGYLGFTPTVWHPIPELPE